MGQRGLTASKLSTNLRCPQRPSSRYHLSDSSSSNGKQLSKKDSTVTSSNQIIHDDKQLYKKRRRKRSSPSSYSLLQQQYKQLPQTTYTNRILTRRELIRLSPKQRTIYHAKRLQQYKDSQSYLDQARTNVRSNIKFLSETADTNFKKNISTIKRLFSGEEVDSVIAEQPKITSATKSAKRKQKLKNEEEESLTNGIDWERAPAEIKANFQSNIASIQNWLHQVSDGKIPSSTYINSSSTSVEHPTGSVANRISKFHQLKQSNELVMDNKWIFKNILLALLPGTLFHLYFRSLQGEMREYYDRVEQDERDKILGYRDEAGVVDASGSDDDESSSTTNVDIGSEESDSSSGKTGLSSAFSITEGENAWEKLKIVVSDLFLGGVEERISRHKSKQQKQENGEQDDAVVETTTNEPTSSRLSSDIPENNSSLPANSSSTNPPNKDLDPTIQTLLHRIEALEQQLGTTSNSTKLKEDLHKKQEQQEQRQKEHQLKRRIERLRQSPIQNRREDKLEAEWRKEEANKKMSKVHVRNNIQDEDDESSSSSSSSSFSFWDVMNFAKSMIEPGIETMRASLKQKMKEVFDTFVNESSEASVEKEVISSALDSTEQPREADVVSTVVSAGDSDLTNKDSITTKNEIQPESNPSSSGGGSLRRWIGKMWRRPTPTPDI